MDIPLVKPLMFVLYGKERLPEAVYGRLEQLFWPIEFKGRAHPFDSTGYYEREFGAPLFRHVICFRPVVGPKPLPEWKWMASGAEEENAAGGKRTCNLDIGYLDTEKVVLASFKNGRNKLYLASGVFGDIQLEYAKGEFTPTPWAFTDFKDNRYYGDLMTIREKLKAGLKHERGGKHG